MMKLYRASSVPPTRQADIEAAYAGINADEIGPHGTEYLRRETLKYMESGTAFCVHDMKGDSDFLDIFRQNQSDMRNSYVKLEKVRAYG